jgi:hypothetical protein
MHRQEPRTRDDPLDLMAGKLNVVSLLLWAILFVSFRPLIPVIWDDGQHNVKSTLEAGRPIVVGGRDPGYPIFLF